MAVTQSRYAPVSSMNPLAERLTRHRFSAAMGDMDEVAEGALKASVAKAGVREPILIWETAEGLQVLDGWHRYQAARNASQRSIPVRRFIGTEEDARELVADKELRRHVSKLERAEATLRLYRDRWAEVGHNQHRGLPESGNPMTTDQLADKAGCSKSTIIEAKRDLIESEQSGLPVAAVRERRKSEAEAEAPPSSKLATHDDPTSPPVPDNGANLGSAAPTEQAAKPSETDELRAEVVDLQARIQELEVQLLEAMDRAKAAESGNDQSAELEALRVSRDDFQSRWRKSEYRVKKLEAEVTDLKAQLSASPPRAAATSGSNSFAPDDGSWAGMTDDLIDRMNAELSDEQDDEPWRN